MVKWLAIWTLLVSSFLIGYLIILDLLNFVNDNYHEHDSEYID